jgi:hypothetical protein
MSEIAAVNVNAPLYWAGAALVLTFFLGYMAAKLFEREDK